MDSQHKSTHIEKIKQNYFDLLNEASEREDKLNKIIKNHEENIMGLQNKIKETESQLNENKKKSFESCETQTHIDVKTSSTMTNAPAVFSTGIQTKVSPEKNKKSNVQTDTTKAEKNGGNKQKNKMNLSEVQQKDNNLLQTKKTSKKKTVCKLNISKDKIGLDIKSSNSLVSETNTTVCSVKKKILLYGDGSSLNCGPIISNELPGEHYLTEAWVKTGARLSDLGDSIYEKSRLFTMNDFVVVFIDLNSICSFSEKTLVNLISVSKYTNLIVCLKCDTSVRRNLYNRVLLTINKFLASPRGINASLKILYNIKLNRLYPYTKRELCKRVVSLIKLNGSSHNIVLKPLPFLHSDKASSFKISTDTKSSLNINTVNIIQGGHKALTAEELDVELVCLHSSSETENFQLSIDGDVSKLMQEMLLTNNKINDFNTPSETTKDHAKNNLIVSNSNFLYPRLSQWNLEEK